MLQIFRWSGDQSMKSTLEEGGTGIVRVYISTRTRRAAFVDFWWDSSKYTNESIRVLRIVDRLGLEREETDSVVRVRVHVSLF